MEQLKHVIDVWTGLAQGLTGSIGALAFVCALACIVETRILNLTALGWLDWSSTGGVRR
jgi:hypothetical protein